MDLQKALSNPEISPTKILNLINVHYLIDTDICVFFLKGKFGLNQKIKKVGIENCYLSEITIAEPKYGAVKSNNPKHFKEVENIEELFHIPPIYNSLEKYAYERVRLEKLGLRIPDFDLLIGVSAVNNDMILVSNNERHLARVENLKLENWTKLENNTYANT
ncbi:MAG TPA: type II toxin-antitoxin system VapC family toxin [Saprospiraceae bacterium]|nr:type II toxin-antitoxin system VapC family toxin [Saprospiraceae bacterium]